MLTFDFEDAGTELVKGASKRASKSSSNVVLVVVAADLLVEVWTAAFRVGNGGAPSNEDMEIRYSNTIKFR